MKKLWIFTELYYPEETSTAFILTKIANKLATKYDVVNVVCLSPTPTHNSTRPPVAYSFIIFCTHIYRMNMGTPSNLR